MLIDTNSRAAMSPAVRWVCRYGSRRSSAGVSGVAPVTPADVLAIVAPAERFDFVDEGAERRTMLQDVVDLAQEVMRGRLIGDRRVGLGEVQSGAHGGEWQQVGQQRTDSHRRREVTVC